MSAADIDDEIETLKARAPAASLKRQLRVQASTLLSSPSTAQLLVSPQEASALPLPSTSDENTPLRGKLAAQAAHNQQCLYRACASVTSFVAQDPDPSAVDAGRVLGLRVEVMTRARFLRPYYVLLNRPWRAGPSASDFLRVHRHTIPPCVPLAGLAARHLPAPPARALSPVLGSSFEEGSGSSGAARGRHQDLAKFVRVLRRELVRYHNRAGVVADLRRAVGLDKKRREEEDREDTSGGAEAETETDKRVVDISAADAEVKHVKIEWADGRTGRLVIGDDGRVLNLVVIGENGRDRSVARELLGDPSHRLEDLAKRLGTV
ncbi:uncharacterized protein E0L32_005474 [Thyridium curvatum]|uniref:Cenp-O kinetochore centromere component n=1 Tax=Thyridium curvatum TaxID=1093900 RepID=A0A507BD58_9PEZI|nr:uncharacterized protein E0L32_005474 [Thyridium curvatum]TPX14510.1 hypothetical protein E0L32_005474 [Thyridium curvatum]